ncbi:MAG: M48 family metalloprotease [Gemmatimonadetes bacterium]|nr:M48 family metalloprotease [Gemmatimonadota bacterium]
MACGARVRTSGTLAVLAALAAAGCAINPATGKNQLMLVSQDQGIAMGRQADTAIIASIGLYPDAALQSYIQQFGARLAATSERPELPWTFRVVDDPAVNAFAVPGGFVYVTRGILTHLTDEAELASVVGHEIGHITARHTAAEMSKQQLIGVGLAVGSIASATVAKYAGTASQALSILYLKYSRDDESQADELGLRYMTRANFDPRRMPEVFRMLEQMTASEGGGQLPTWLSTHPSPGNRVDAITTQIATLPQNFSGTTVNRDSYLRRLDGQVFGADPREGYFQGSRFLHPDMRFQLTFPEGWATQNSRQAVVAVSPAQDGAVEVATAQEASANAAAGAFLAQQGITGGATSRASVHGLTTVSAPFAAETSSGAVRGMVLFVEYRGGVFALIGYAPDARWSTYKTVVEGTLHSFQALTDPAALNAQPQRVEIVKIAARTTITALARQRPSPVSAATLALINQVALDTPLEAGRLVKWVVGPASLATKKPQNATGR